MTNHLEKNEEERNEEKEEDTDESEFQRRMVECFVSLMLLGKDEIGRSIVDRKILVPSN